MSDYFLEEIIHEILLRLPIKSLIKFRAVCKSWWSLIQTSAFIQTHLSRTVESSNQNDAQLFLLHGVRVPGEYFSLYWDKPESGEHTKLINPFIYDNTTFLPQKRTSVFQNFHVVGTCDGLICIAANSATIIWNPSVRKFMFLPRPRIPSSTEYDTRTIASYAFGYDWRTNDYKVLRIVCSVYRKSLSEVEVWSLARGSWKSLSPDVIPVDFSTIFVDLGDRQAVVNGVLHWLQYYECEDSCILWFDIVSELFGKILLPDALRKKFCVMSRYRESLALFENPYDVSDRSYRIHMWVMEELGVAESWTKLLNICLEATSIMPFGFRKSGEVVFRMCDGELVSVNPKTKQVKKFVTDGCEYQFMDSFVESLVLLDQPNAISY